jgi:hypothetical protein
MFCDRGRVTQVISSAEAASNLEGEGHVNVSEGNDSGAKHVIHQVETP